MAFDADIDLVTYLIANVTEKTLVLGTSAFHGPERPVETGVVDAKAIFVIPFGGPAPETFSVSTTSVYEPQLQIIIRGDKTSYRDTLDLAREIRDLVQSDGVPVLADYIDVQVIESEPNYLGETDKGHPRFSLNVIAKRDD